MIKDTYNTIAEPSEEMLYKEKNSKFFSYAFPISSEEEVKPILEEIKKKHHTARHWCYAFQTGTDQKIYYRANDDGEPSNTAGMPIYGQIQSFDITNVLMVVVRYFGGVKLGVGGLIVAYRESAKMALENSTIIEETIDVHFAIRFDYKNMNKVMRVIKEKNLIVVHQIMELDCYMEIKIRKKFAEAAQLALENLYEIEVKTI